MFLLSLVIMMSTAKTLEINQKGVGGFVLSSAPLTLTAVLHSRSVMSHLRDKDLRAPGRVEEWKVHPSLHCGPRRNS